MNKNKINVIVMKNKAWLSSSVEMLINNIELLLLLLIEWILLSGWFIFNKFTIKLVK